jgi:hypothetical protein
MGGHAVAKKIVSGYNVIKQREPVSGKQAQANGIDSTT